MLRAGILYPSVESQGMARNLLVALSGQDIPTIGEGLNIIEPHNALALKLKTEEDRHGVPPYYPNLPSGFQMLEMLDKQISALDPGSVILCSEVFALLGLTEKRESIKRLARRFAHHEVTIYCNLRRPDEYISSWHRQRLKFGAKLAKLSEGALDEYLNGAHFQQAKLIEGWVTDHFPDAKLVIRNFDDVKAAGGSVKDFIASSGIAFPEHVNIPKDQNPSVPSAFAEIGRRALHELPRETASQIVGWLSSAGARVAHHSDKQVEVFGPENREILLSRFRPVAEKLNEMTGRHPFYPNFEDFGCCRPIAEMDAVKDALPGLVLDARRQGLPESILDWLNNWKN